MASAHTSDIDCVCNTDEDVTRALLSSMWVGVLAEVGFNPRVSGEPSLNGVAVETVVYLRHLSLLGFLFPEMDGFY